MLLFDTRPAVLLLLVTEQQRLDARLLGVAAAGLKTTPREHRVFFNRFAAAAATWRRGRAATFGCSCITQLSA